MLEPLDFYSERRRAIYQLIQNLYTKFERIDELIVRSELGNKLAQFDYKKQDFIFEKHTLCTRDEIMHWIHECSPACVEGYCAILRKAAAEREMRDRAQQMINGVNADCVYEYVDIITKWKWRRR